MNDVAEVTWDNMNDGERARAEALHKNGVHLLDLTPRDRAMVLRYREEMQTARTPTSTGSYGPHDDTSPGWENAIRAMEDGGTP